MSKIISTFRTIFLPALLLTAFLALLPACSTAPASPSARADLQSDADSAVAHARKTDPSLDKFFAHADSYAVFPTVGKGAIGVGGAFGHGILYQHAKPAGYCDLSQASLGLQLGGQAYTEIIFFETPAATARFQSGNFAFAATASAVALKSGAAANAKYANGVAVFTLSESGLMFEASLGGQKFAYQSINSPP